MRGLLTLLLTSGCSPRRKILRNTAPSNLSFQSTRAGVVVRVSFSPCENTTREQTRWHLPVHLPPSRPAQEVKKARAELYSQYNGPVDSSARAQKKVATEQTQHCVEPTLMTTLCTHGNDSTLVSALQAYRICKRVAHLLCSSSPPLAVSLAGPCCC